jgi:hypothetical protein
MQTSEYYSDKKEWNSHTCYYMREPEIIAISEMIHTKR